MFNQIYFSRSINQLERAHPEVLRKYNEGSLPRKDSEYITC